MPKTTTKTRLTYLTLVASSATLPCASLPAQTQSDALRYCATLEDGAERLRCFDAISIDDSPEFGAAETRAAEPAPEPAAGPPGAPAAPASTSPATTPPESEATPVRQMVTVAVPSLGDDGSDPPPAEFRPYQITVVNVIEKPARPVVFETEDGNFWTKTSRGIHKYPDPPFGATIEERGLGTLWLVLAEGGRSVRVTRSE